MLASCVAKLLVKRVGNSNARRLSQHTPLVIHYSSVLSEVCWCVARIRCIVAASNVSVVTKMHMAACQN
jgi:hypothetical protein